MKDIYYFGTNLTSAGHGYYAASKDGKYLESCYKSRMVDMPFHPESVTENMALGDIHWFHSKSRHGDITVCAIYGSCYDDRPGSKTVFWTHENLTPEQMKERIFSIPCFKQIIDKLPFEVKW